MGSTMASCCLSWLALLDTCSFGRWPTAMWRYTLQPCCNHGDAGLSFPVSRTWRWIGTWGSWLPWRLLMKGIAVRLHLFGLEHPCLFDYEGDRNWYFYMFDYLCSLHHFIVLLPLLDQFASLCNILLNRLYCTRIVYIALMSPEHFVRSSLCTSTFWSACIYLCTLTSQWLCTSFVFYYL
jgi:hypothetical protein